MLVALLIPLPPLVLRSSPLRLLRSFSGMDELTGACELERFCTTQSPSAFMGSSAPVQLQYRLLLLVLLGFGF